MKPSEQLLSEQLKFHRLAVHKIINVAQKEGITNFSVFGFVAKVTDIEDSDLDVKAPPRKYLYGDPAK